jgi:DNA-binding transcriptional MerR regulator
MPTEHEYAIGELASLAGVTPRTIRYYVSIGLLPSPGQQGPGTRYGEGHLARLRLIRRLQREHLPLGEITTRLAGLDDATVEGALLALEGVSASEAAEAAVDSGVGTGPPGSMRPPGSAGPPASMDRSVSDPRTGQSALEYIRRLRQGPSMEPMPAREPAGARSVPSVAMRLAAPGDSLEILETTEAAPWQPSAPEESTKPPGPVRTQWERVPLGQNVEVHIRRPLGRLEQKRVERLIRIGREILEEGDQP